MCSRKYIRNKSIVCTIAKHTEHAQSMIYFRSNTKKINTICLSIFYCNLFMGRVQRCDGRQTTIEIIMNSPLCIAIL